MTATEATTGASPEAESAAAPAATHHGLPHVGALDGLRGVAVAAVLLHHGGRLTGGWLGVDLFFVLSGYLITALLLTGWRADANVGLGRFWARRARRLTPALVITLLGVGAYAVLVAQPTELLAIRNDGFATLFEVANWRTIAVGGDYWAAKLAPLPLRHTWSLAIEEQLYLLWPLAVAGVLAWRRRAGAVLALASVAAAASAAALVVLHAGGASRSRLYYGTDTRASTVMLGAALAALRVVLGPQRWAATRRIRHSLGLVAAAGVLLAWARLDGASALPYQGVLPLVSLGGALLVAAVADRRHPGPLGSALAVPPLRWLGRISYGVYLYHWPLYLVLDEDRTNLTGWALLGVRVAVTLALAEVSYRFVEEPIRSGRWLHGRQARAALPAGAALASIALIAGTLGAQSSLADLASGAGRLERSSVPGAPTVLVAGDSVPLLLGVELGQQRNELGLSVVNRAAPGCHLLAALGPIRGIEGDVRTDVADCSLGGQYREDVEEFRPDVVVVLFGEFPNQAVELEGRFTMPCDDLYMGALRSRLDQLVADLRTGDTPVVLLKAPGTSLSWVLERVEPGMPERVACSNAMLDDIARAQPGVTVIDLASYICPPGEPCLEEVDGVDLRPDGLHFQDEGAELVNRWLAPQLKELAAKG